MHNIRNQLNMFLAICLQCQIILFVFTRLEGNLQGSCKLLQTTLKVKEDILSTDHPSKSLSLSSYI